MHNILLKKVYGFLKKAQIQTPIPKIAIALSGGSDSVALALLLGKYGKHLYSESLVFVHINHMWREEESFKDQKFVEELGRKLGVDTHIYLCPPENDSLSKELEARNQRLNVFKQYTDQGYIIFTGHNSNDVLETMLWRLCEGQISEYDKGILVKTPNHQFRPFLTTTKEYLQQFLLKENQIWCEDKTNHDGLLMRSFLRKNVIPQLKKIYPKIYQNVSQEAIRKQIF